MSYDCELVDYRQELIVHLRHSRFGIVQVMTHLLHSVGRGRGSARYSPDPHRIQAQSTGTETKNIKYHISYALRYDYNVTGSNSDILKKTLKENLWKNHTK